MVEPDETRVFAVLALAAFACAVVTGEILAGGLGPAGRRPRVFRIHRAAAVGGLCLAGLHVASVVVAHDPEVDLSQVVVPGMDEGDRNWIALGLLSLAMMAAAGASWMLRRRLSRRASPSLAESIPGPGRRAPVAGPRWMAIHKLAYVGFASAVAHAVLAHPGGPPAPEAIAYAVGVGILAALLVMRLRRTHRAPGTSQQPGLHALP